MTNAGRAAHPAALLMTIRTVHTWIGMLIAPAVLFMAFTGMLQLYNFHEARPGYTPPPLIEKFGRLHKDQVYALDDDHGPPPGAHAPPAAGPHGAPDVDAGPPPGEHHGPKPAVMILKFLLAWISIGLMVSTLLGLWMALRDRQKRLIHGVLLLIGAVVPTVLAMLTG